MVKWIENQFQAFLFKPRRRGDALEKFDVSRLSAWAMAKAMPFFVLAWLSMAALISAMGDFPEWGGRITLLFWLFLGLIPMACFFSYLMKLKNGTISSMVDRFPRFHTMEHYRFFIQFAGVAAFVMALVLLFWKNPMSSQILSLAGLSLAVLLTVFAFEGALHLARTQAPSDFLSARESSWSPQKEAADKKMIEDELMNLSSKLETLYLVEDLNEGQKKDFDAWTTRQKHLQARLARINNSDEGNLKTISFHYPWLTGSGNPEGELITVKYKASERRNELFRKRNEQLFLSWKSERDEDDHSQTYEVKLGEWGKSYVSDPAWAEHSMETKTLSYNLFNIVHAYSLSELQQVELCLAACQAFTKPREEIPSPELNIHIKRPDPADFAPKRDRLEAIMFHLWEIACLHEKITPQEEGYVFESIKYWQSALQLVDDEDEDVDLTEIREFFNKLKKFSEEGEGSLPSVDYPRIAEETLTPNEHDELINNLESLNSMSINNYQEKYDSNLLRISDLKTRFEQTDNIHAEEKSFQVSKYPRFPTETLCGQGGDCDDTAILLAAILRDCGYEVKLYRTVQTDPDKGEIEGMGVGVKIQGSEDQKLFETDHRHKNMIYCEATPDGWYSGIMPHGAVEIPIDIEPLKKAEELQFEF